MRIVVFDIFKVFYFCLKEHVVEVRDIWQKDISGDVADGMSVRERHCVDIVLFAALFCIASFVHNDGYPRSMSDRCDKFVVNAVFIKCV